MPILATQWNDYYEGTPTYIPNDFTEFQNDAKYYSKRNEYVDLSYISIQFKSANKNITLLIEECTFTNIKTQYVRISEYDYKCGAIYLGTDSSNITLAKNAAQLCYGVTSRCDYYYAGANSLQFEAGYLSISLILQLDIVQIRITEQMDLSSYGFQAARKESTFLDAAITIHHSLW